jgi:hypothetical protein
MYKIFTILVTLIFSMNLLAMEYLYEGLDSEENGDKKYNDQNRDQDSEQDSEEIFVASMNELNSRPRSKSMKSFSKKFTNHKNGTHSGGNSFPSTKNDSKKGSPLKRSPFWHRESNKDEKVKINQADQEARKREEKAKHEEQKRKQKQAIRDSKFAHAVQTLWFDEIDRLITKKGANLQSPHIIGIVNNIEDAGLRQALANNTAWQTWYGSRAYKAFIHNKSFRDASKNTRLQNVNI